MQHGRPNCHWWPVNMAGSDDLWLAWFGIVKATQLPTAGDVEGQWRGQSDFRSILRAATLLLYQELAQWKNHKSEACLEIKKENSIVFYVWFRNRMLIPVWTCSENLKPCS